MKILSRLKTALMCAVRGHEPFEMGGVPTPRLIQSKDIGNAYRDIQVCKHCDTVYGVRGELSASELAEEARLEEYNRVIRERMQEALDKNLKAITEATIKAGGNIALN